MNNRLLEKIRDCADLPSLPAVALRVMDLTQKDDVTSQQVADAISLDPALVAKVLRTVNSPFYGCSQAISSMNGAVVLLGMQSVKTLVLGFSIVSALSTQNTKGFDHLTYWRRSLYAAMAARILGAKVWVTEKEACFLSALLMDVGMLVMDKMLGDTYAACVAKARNHAELMAAEDKAFEINHQMVAAILAEKWKLPELLAVPMANHHTPDKVQDSHTKVYADVVALAARCADIFVDKQPMWSIADVRRICVEKFHIKEMDCDSMLCEIGMRTKELAPLFAIKVDSEATYDKILARANEQLLDVTRVAQDKEENSDRRRAPRIKRNKDVVILPCSDGVVKGTIPVRLQDVSARGVGFLHTEPMEKGSQFIFRVPRTDTVPITLLYTVVRCVPTADGKFTIGGSLECVLREDGVAQPITEAPDIKAA
ncbi:MAG TPA: HDOD domain-containing protein [Tepidisphaeraceae bacterium]|nr:HDOD domain-containing protein [Tepidisphaeraceae bacterium]